ncbi:MAG: antitoxin Xre/MbcA/ParS toxin-binding domain-containing protein [Leeuwenhoekiella sp.]
MATAKKYPIYEDIPVQVNEAALLYYMEESPVGVESIDFIRDISGFNDTTIAEWLNINVKTLRSYKSGQTVLKDYVQEKVAILLALFKHGKEVFGSFDDFSTWLQLPNFFFDKRPPADFMTTFSGTKFIDDRLTGMEYGDNA